MLLRQSPAPACSISLIGTGFNANSPNLQAAAAAGQEAWGTFLPRFPCYVPQAGRPTTPDETLSMTLVLVTGAGFIGSHLAELKQRMQAGLE